MCPMSLGTSQGTRALETGQAKLWLLAIGVDRYIDPGLTDLRYSVLDCRGASEALADATQTFPQRETYVLCDGAVTAPTVTAVRMQLKKLVASVAEPDTVLIYFSGHGLLDDASDRAYLCLHDTQLDKLERTALGLQELLAALDTCSARQQLVWLDACHSGSMSWRGARDGAPPVLTDPTAQMMTLLRQRAARSSGFYAMLSCDRGQQAWEFPQLGHGVFTYFLMRGLRGEAADERGAIDADGLYRYIYHHTIQYIDKANQQLRLINQQQRSRGATQLQPEYPLQTPKRIVEGVGELVIGLKPPLPAAPHPRQASIADGLSDSTQSLALGKRLQGAGHFELHYWPQPGRSSADLQQAIATTLQVSSEAAAGDPERSTPDLSTALLYLRGRAEVAETGEALLTLGADVRLSRSWLRQQLRRSRATHQVVILELLDLQGEAIEEWLEDLQIAPERGQCLLVSAPTTVEEFAPVLTATLAAADTRNGLTVAEWIVRLQEELAGTAAVPHVWLSGMQGAIEVLPGDIGTRGKRRSPLDLGVCPYVGLRAFAETDAPYFFGREELTQRLLGELERRAALAVVGPSGSGKSSVVRAGLMAQLRQGKRLPGSDRWWLRSFRPGAQPLAALAQCLVDSGTEKEQAYQRLQLEGMLFEGAEGFARWLRSRPEPTVVLVIDQLEELFTLASRTDCQRVMQILLGALEYVSDRFKLVMTLRTDFMATALEVPGLAPILQEASIFVPPHLNDADYRRAIVRPAEAVGLEVEPELVEVVLQDLDRAAGDLPLLEFVLAQLWEARQPGCLTLQVYQREIGGLKGALERKAQAIYDSLDDEARDCTRWIFLSLTQLGEGTEDTRRRTLKSELIVAKYPEALVERTLQVLTTAKLIVVSAGEDDWQRGIQRSDEAEADRPDRTDDNALDAIAPPEPTVEVAHEALIRHWSTLRWWLEENRSRLRARRQIEAAAQQWKQHGKQPDFLLQGVRLDAAAEVYLEAADELSQDVRAFIEAGLAARDARSEQLRRRLRRARQAIATISLLAVAAVGLGGVAMQQRQRAQLSQIATLHQLSTSHLLAGRGLDGAIAALRAGRQVERLWSWGLGAAQRQQVEWQVASALQQSSTFGRDRNRLDGHTRTVNSVSLSPDGSRIASGSDDTTVRLWQTDGTLLHQLDDHTARVTSVAFSPDGKWLATADADGAIWLRQAEDGRPIRALKDRGAWVTQLAFAPDGGRLAAATRDRAVDIWDVESGQVALTLEGHGGWVTDVQFSPAGEVIATASDDGTVKLWSVTDGELLHTSPARNSGGWASVAFSPDGQTLAIASINGAIALWNWDADPESSAAWTEIVSDREAGSLTHVLTFNSDGTQLLTGGADGMLRVWNLSGVLLAMLRGHEDAVTDVQIAADNPAVIVSSSADRTVRVWDLPPLDLDPTVRGASSVAFVPNDTGDRQAVTGEWDGSVKLWTLTSNNAVLARDLLGPSRQPASSLSISPNSSELALARADGAVAILSLQPAGGTRMVAASDIGATHVVFSPDGVLLAAGSADGTVRVWQAESGSERVTLTAASDGVSAIAFSPDGRWLAASSHDGNVYIWQVETGDIGATLPTRGEAIAFSPDGQQLAVGSEDGAIAFWQWSDKRVVQSTIGHTDRVTSLQFSSDGSTLLSGSADRTLRLWQVSEGSLLATLAGHRGAVGAARFSPDELAIVSVSDADGLKTWSLELETLMATSCRDFGNYLQTNMRVDESDRLLCPNP